MGSTYENQTTDSTQTGEGVESFHNKSYEAPTRSLDSPAGDAQDKEGTGKGKNGAS